MPLVDHGMVSTGVRDFADNSDIYVGESGTS